MQKFTFFILLVVVIGCAAWACGNPAQNQALANTTKSQNSRGEPERQNSNDESALQPSCSGLINRTRNSL